MPKRHVALEVVREVLGRPELSAHLFLHEGAVGDDS